MLYHLGNAREKLEKLDLAAQDYFSVIKLDNTHAAAYHGLGLIYDKMNNFAEAIKYFDKALELDFENAIYWHNRGCSYRNLGR